jgi:hypothetical protein
MRMSSVTARLQEILERDWKSEAAELLAQRKAAGEGPVCLPIMTLYHYTRLGADLIFPSFQLFTI